MSATTMALEVNSPKPIYDPKMDPNPAEFPYPETNPSPTELSYPDKTPCVLAPLAWNSHIVSGWQTHSQPKMAVQ